MSKVNYHFLNFNILIQLYSNFNCLILEVIYSKIMRKFTYTLDNDEKLEKVVTLLQSNKKKDLAFYS